MPLPTLFPGHDPTTTPATANVRTGQQGGAVGGFVVRPLVGVNIAFASSALTDEPLWIRIDDPGSI